MYMIYGSDNILCNQSLHMSNLNSISQLICRNMTGVNNAHNSAEHDLRVHNQLNLHTVLHN